MKLYEELYDAFSDALESVDACLANPQHRKEHNSSILAYADTIRAAIAAGEFMLDGDIFMDTLMSFAAETEEGSDTRAAGSLESSPDHAAPH